MTPVNTHHVVVTFGKYKGELWTRVPFSYLNWLINQGNLKKEIRALAESELLRRGTITPKCDVSAHAVDRASLKLLTLWQEEHGKNEGLQSWLARRAEAALEHGATQESKDRVCHRGVLFVFDRGLVFPTLLTVFPDRDHVEAEAANGND